ncbi:MAG: TetR/AcrR family transcriptional regulator [Actinomycetota bacterium]
MVTSATSASSSGEITDRLISAAIAVFTEGGFEKAGVAAIARRAGLTTGAIYSRWAGKQELFLDALDVVFVKQVAPLLAAGPDSSAADVLESLGADLLARDHATDALILESWVMARRDPAFREILIGRLRDEEGHLATLVDHGKASGLIDPSLSTSAIITLCQAISFGFVVLGSIEKPVAPADEWNAVIHRLIAAALPHTPSASPDVDPPPPGDRS